MEYSFCILWIFCFVSSNNSLEQDACRMSSTYYFHHKRLTWNKSREWCQKELGADLVSIETKEEWEYLKIFIQKLTDPTKHVEYYIGLRNESGDFQWLSNNEIVPADNWRWQKDEPSGDGMCVVMYRYYLRKEGHFNDLPCEKDDLNGTIGFICERTDAGCNQPSPCQDELKNENDGQQLVDHWILNNTLLTAILVAVAISVNVALFIIVVFLCRAVCHDEINPKVK